jgi:hypothetical protein
LSESEQVAWLAMMKYLATEPRKMQDWAFLEVFDSKQDSQDGLQHFA